MRGSATARRTAIAAALLPLAAAACGGSGSSLVLSRSNPKNLVPNPTFDRNLDFWQAYGSASLKRSTLIHRAGAASAEAVAGLSGTMYGVALPRVVGDPLRGSRYALTFWAKGPRNLPLVATAGSGGFPPAAAKTFFLTGRWQRLRLKGRLATADRSSLGIYLLRRNAVGPNDHFYIDAVTLRLLRAGSTSSTETLAASAGASPVPTGPAKTMRIPYRPTGDYLDWGTGPDTWQLDSAGIPVVYYGPKIGLRHNPVTTAEYGLWRLGRWGTTFSGADLAAARKQANWLVATQDRRSGKWFYTFPYPSYQLASHWSSALAQGLAMSFLTRMWRTTHDTAYLQRAVTAVRPLERPLRGGGLADSLRGHLWFEEYPSHPPTHVLNGFMFTLLGLYDVHHWIPASPAGRLFRDGVESLAFALPLFDAGSGRQYYDLRQLVGRRAKVASGPYLPLDVQLLRALNSVAPHPVFRRYIKRWSP
jgi:hypothetical protein